MTPGQQSRDRRGAHRVRTDPDAGRHHGGGRSDPAGAIGPRDVAHHHCGDATL